MSRKIYGWCIVEGSLDNKVLRHLVSCAPVYCNAEEFTEIVSQKLQRFREMYPKCDMYRRCQITADYIRSIGSYDFLATDVTGTHGLWIESRRVNLEDQIE